MTGVPAPRESVGVDSVPVMIARLEGKVDVALAQQGATIASHDREIADHETRLRTVEGKVPENAQDRLRAVEDRSTVSWRQLWAAVASAAGALAVLSPLIERLYSIHP